MNMDFLYQRRNALALICALAAVVFGLSLANGFVWDDWELIVPNEIYRSFDFWKIFFSRANGLEYLPVKDLTLALDYSLWGGRPLGFHLTNLLLYLISLPVVYGTAARLARLAGEGREELIAFWTTLLFALHPLHAEPVNFITARNTILAGLFTFASLNMALDWLERGRGWRAAAALLLFVLALLSKAHSVFLPLVLAAVLLIAPARAVSRRGAVLFLLALLALDGAAIFTHLRIAGESAILSDKFMRFGLSSWSVKAAAAVQIPLFYLEKLAAPGSLSVSYSSSFLTNVPSLRFVFSLLLLFGAAAAAWRTRKTRPFLAIAIAWYFISLIPVMNIIPANPPVADRYAYFAVFGVAAVMAGCMVVSGRAALPAAIVAAGVLLYWGHTDINRTRDWRNDFSLWSSAIAEDPGTDRRNLAQAFWKSGRYEEALDQLRMDRERNGSHTYFYYEGLLHMRRGEVDRAIESLTRALAEGGESHKDVHLAAARAYEARGLEKTALAHYLKAEEASSVDPLGTFTKQAREGIGRTRERFALPRKRLEFDARSKPGNIRSQSEYAILLHELGHYDEAVFYYRRALDAQPGIWALWYNIGLARMKQKRWGDAIAVFQEALRIAPDQRDVLNNLAICLTSARRYAEARSVYESALALHPDFLSANVNLGRLHFRMGDRVQAARYFHRAQTIAGRSDPVQTQLRQYLAELNISGTVIGLSSVGPW